MIKTNILLTITVSYILLLFIVAYISNTIFKKKPKLINNPYIYSLTLCVYCTAWTYYGSIGRAATNGIEFLAIYIGPTLITFTWWFLLRKIVRISENYNIHSIADFVSFRYGRSKRIGIMVTAVCLLAIIPYISLQLKAINETIRIISATSFDKEISFYKDSAFYVALLIGVFGAIFGIKHFEDKRKHPGLIGVVAAESIVKLVIMLTAGIYITFFMFHGLQDIFDQLLSNTSVNFHTGLVTLGSNDGQGYMKWFSMSLMSMAAVMFLPRQFHMAVVENFDEKHISKGMYLFPLYLFLINLFVLPIAFAGLLKFNMSVNPDYYIISLFMSEKNYFMTVLVYLGGLTAATGMIIVSSISLSNMIINNTLVPLFVNFVLKSRIGVILPHLKRVIIIAILIFSYIYYKYVGEHLPLVDIGLTSFAAISQIAPAIILGLFFKDINKFGAVSGIVAGSFIWFYTLILPHIIGISPDQTYPLGLKIFSPYALFGLSGLDMWSHSLFWSIFFNITILIFVSIVTKSTEAEKETASLSVESLKFTFLIDHHRIVEDNLTIDDLQNILANFFGEKSAKSKIDSYLEQIGKNRDNLLSYETSGLINAVENMLSQAVGPGASKLIVESYREMMGKGERRVINVFKDLITLGVGESRDTLIHRISELNLLLELSKLFSSPMSLQAKLQKGVETIKTSFKLDLIIIRRRIGNDLIAAAKDGFVANALFEDIKDIDPHTTFIAKSVFEKKQIAVNDISIIDDTSYTILLKQNGIESFCHTPLIINGEVHGVLSFFSKHYKGIFKGDFLNILQSIANQMAFLINNHYQTEDLIRMKEYSKEMEIAKNIQSSLIPKTYPEISNFNISALYSPSDFIGGDYYDVLKVDENNYDFIIADVSGHNAASALIMSELRSIVRTINSVVTTDKSPAEIVSMVSKEIFDDIHKHEFIITLLYIRINIKTNSFIYANAGHYTPLVIIDNGDIIELSSGDPLIGIFKEFKYTNYTFNITNTKMIMLYTDGIIEAENENGDFFTKDRLKDLLRNNTSADSKKLIDIISKSHKLFIGNNTQKDDISLLIIEKNKPFNL